MTIGLLLLIFSVGCGGSQTMETAAEPTETTVEGITLKPMKVIDGRLSLLIPDGFTVMTDDLLRVKYPTDNRPTLVYTNENGSVNVAINHTQNRMAMSQLDEARQAMEAAFQKVHPTAKWYEKGPKTINGRDWQTLNLETTAIDTQIRNMMVFTSSDNRMLMTSVNITKELEGQWLKAGEAIVESLVVHD